MCAGGRPECLLLAKTYRPSHLRGTSGMAPTPDLLAAMSGFRLIPSGIISGSDVPGTLGVRGVLTHNGSEDWAASLVRLGNAVAKLPPDFLGGE